MKFKKLIQVNEIKNIILLPLKILEQGVVGETHT